MIAINSDEQKSKFEIQVIEVGRGTIVSRAPLPEGIAGIVRCARFSPDDRYIDAMGPDLWSKAVVWDCV